MKSQMKGFREPRYSRNTVSHVLLSAFVFALVATLLPATAGAQIEFVQLTDSAPTKVSSLTAVYSSAQTAGDLNIVAIGYDSSSITVKSISDAEGNTYKLAASYSNSSVGISQSIYYASNIAAAAANANTVTVTLSGSAGYPDLRIAEYSGVNTLDETAGAGATSGTTASSGSVTTTQADELLFGTNYTYGNTTAAESGWTARVLSDGNGDIVEDDIVSATGSYAATATVTSDNWVMQLATFYNSSGASSSCSSAPSVPSAPTASGTTNSGTTLSWKAVTPPSNCSITSYTVVENNSAIGTTTSPSYSVTGLSASTTYTFSIEATDSYGTSTASATTSVTTAAGSCAAAPSAPSAPTASGTTSSGTSLSWTAVTPPSNCSITSYTVVENNSAIGTMTSTSYSVTGLSASTTYTFSIEATDSYGTSTASATTSVTTAAAASTICQSIDVPLYYNPPWTTAIEDSPLPTGMSQILIINPDSGPGSSISQSYVSGVQSIHSAGMLAYGYVYTDYGDRSLSSVESDINSYNSWYGVDGIFLDEAASSASLVSSYYQPLANYITSQKSGAGVMMNPGEFPDESYLEITVPSNSLLMVNVFEGTYSNYVDESIPSWVSSFPASKFSNIVYSTTFSEMSNAVTLSQQRNVGWIYVTNAGGSNPYDVLPSYWSSLTSLVEGNCQ